MPKGLEFLDPDSLRPGAALLDRSHDAEHRSRLLEGMATAVAGSGYAVTTIADVVREAGVSRRVLINHSRSFRGNPVHAHTR